MTNKERKLLINLLEMAADHYSNHGCNECPEEWFNNWTKQERIDLDKRLNDELFKDPKYEAHGFFRNDLLFAYFREIFKKEVYLMEALKEPSLTSEDIKMINKVSKNKDLLEGKW